MPGAITVSPGKICRDGVVHAPGLDCNLCRGYVSRAMQGADTVSAGTDDVANEDPEEGRNRRGQ